MGNKGFVPLREGKEGKRQGRDERIEGERRRGWMDGWMDGWLGFNGILSTQVAAISCLRKFKVC